MKEPSKLTTKSATLVGATAILMWASMATLTTWTGGVPPFQLAALGLGLASVMSAVKWFALGQPVGPLLRERWWVYVFGVGGIFGFHFFYFMAFRSATAVEANLLIYFWPLLIVVFSALLPGERVRWWHGAGTGLGLVGMVLLMAGSDEPLSLKSSYMVGYLCAVAAAVTWAGYSVISRRLAAVPTDVVGVFCIFSAMLAAICHLVVEQTVWPEGWQWAAVLAMGLGPMGAAFFVWDVGVKVGSVRTLGAMAYATPLLSTLLLIASGSGRLTLWVGAACVLIVGGGVLGGLDLLARPSQTNRANSSKA